MSDALYETDAFTWSFEQADLLRLIAAGKTVKGVDWDNVIESVEQVGMTRLGNLYGTLQLMLLHLLKLAGWPNHAAVSLWRDQVALFQDRSVQRFIPSMQQSINMETIFSRAVEQLQTFKYPEWPTWPDACPYTVEDLLSGDPAELESRLAALVERPAPASDPTTEAAPDVRREQAA